MATDGLKTLLEDQQRALTQEFEALKARNAEIPRTIEELQREVARNLVRIHELRGAFEALTKLHDAAAAAVLAESVPTVHQHTTARRSKR